MSKYNIENLLNTFRIKFPLYKYTIDSYLNNKQKIKIECQLGHVFNMSVSQHLKGYGCSYCSGYKKSKNDILDEINKKHNFKYKYPNFNYSKIEDSIEIICPTHGKFTKSVKLHKRGVGCSKCSNRYSPNSEDFIKFCKKIEPELDYSFTEYKNNKTKNNFICKKHGLISKSPNNIKTHICDSCYNIGKNFKIFKEKAKLKYGDRFEYHNYNNNKSKLKIIDKETGFIYYQSPRYHLNCNYFYNKRTITDFIKKAKEIHGDKYDYRESIYIGNKNNISIFCKKHGEFKQIVNNHLRGAGCPICNRFDKKENEIYDFIKDNYNNEIIKSDRSILHPKELDIYLPHLKLAFEFNGVYWHSELYKEKNYHSQKTKDCLEKGINLIHIWEDDWQIKKEITKSIILNKLGKSNRIFARNCKIIEITDNRLVRQFLEENHIQGFVGSKVKLGLYFNEELISLMTFGDLRKSLGQNSKNGHFELLRFCNKINTSIIGGVSKLFKYFINKYKPSEIISYSDNSRGNGNMYEKLGFDILSETVPNYYWVIDGVRKNRFNFRKDKLIKEGADPNKTEKEIMSEKGYYRIFDCGSKKWLYKNKS